jgi:L,D-peptidoglycan transpeptidase YkuD (ErfK/YbiS/YcfS/YnhG family)
MQKNTVPAEIRVRRSALDPRRAILAVGQLRMPCVLGRGGTSIFKREGDGATPVAAMALLGCYVRSGRLPGVRPALPTIRSHSDSGWCDAPTHPAYNRPVRLPFPASSETLQRADRLYDLVVVLDWNITRRGRGRGSAIFLHIAREGYAPTEGCIAISPTDMRRLAPCLRKGVRLTVLR